MTSIIKSGLLASLTFLPSILLAETDHATENKNWVDTAHHLVELGNCLESSFGLTNKFLSQPNSASDELKQLVTQIESKTSEQLATFDEILSTIRTNQKLEYNYTIFKSKGHILLSMSQRAVLRARTQIEESEVLEAAQKIRDNLKCFQTTDSNIP